MELAPPCNELHWLLGVIGPFPRPLWIRDYASNFIIDDNMMLYMCQCLLKICCEKIDLLFSDFI